MFYNVTIAGKEYPIAFNFNALAAYGRKRGLKFSEVLTASANFSNMEMEEFLEFVICLFEEGARISGKDLEVTIEFLGENILAGNFINVLTKAIEEGMATGKP